MHGKECSRVEDLDLFVCGLILNGFMLMCLAKYLTGFVRFTVVQDGVVDEWQRCVPAWTTIVTGEYSYRQPTVSLYGV